MQSAGMEAATNAIPADESNQPIEEVPASKNTKLPRWASATSLALDSRPLTRMRVKTLDFKLLPIIAKIAALPLSRPSFLGKEALHFSMPQLPLNPAGARDKVLYFLCPYRAVI